MSGSGRDPAGVERNPAPDANLRAGDLLLDLETRSLRGGGVIMIAQLVKVLAQIATIATLARLIAPSDFGLFAIVAALLAFLEIFKDLGLSMATVQRPRIDHGELSTLFWINLALGVGIAAATAALGPALAWVYGEPILLEITVAASMGFVFTSLAAQHLALVRRRMRFGTLAVIQVGSELAGLIAATVAAFAGLGIWALVLQRLVWTVALAGGAWWCCDWRPGRPGGLRTVRAFLVFGGNATAAMSINHFTTSLDHFAIGWFWGSELLGHYERGRKIVKLPVQTLNTPLFAVMMPTLSRVADDPLRYRDAYLSVVEKMVMIMGPVGGLLLAAGDWVTMVVLGPGWSVAGSIVSWTGLTFVYMPATYSLSWLYLSQDRTGEMLSAGVAGSALLLVALAAGLPFGPVGVAAAYAVSGLLIRAPLLFHLACRSGPVGTRDLYAALQPGAAAAAMVAAAVWSVRQVDEIGALGAAAGIAVLVPVAGVVSLAIYAGLPDGRRALRELAGALGILLRRASG